MLARVRRFSQSVPSTEPYPLPTLPSDHMSACPAWHSSHVFLPLPILVELDTCNFLQEGTQSSLPFRSRCPNHLSWPRLTTSATFSTPNRLYNLSLDILFFRLRPTPQIHLTIICSVLSSLGLFSSIWSMHCISWESKSGLSSCESRWWS